MFDSISTEYELSLIKEKNMKRAIAGIILFGIYAGAGIQAGKTEAIFIKLTELEPYLLHKLQGHEKEVKSAAFSPDGKIIASAGGDNSVRLWDATTGMSVGEPMMHDSPVISVAFSPDGKIIASAGTDKTVQLRDAKTGKSIVEPLGETIWHGSMVTSVAFSPNGKIIASAGTDKTVRLWDTATGKPLSEPLRHDGIVSSAAFSPDGKIIASAGDDKTVRLWDAATGKPLGEPIRHDDIVSSAAFSPDGKIIASAGGDNSVRLWDAATGKPLGKPLTHDGPVISVAFSPDGKIIASVGTDNIVRLWQANDAAVMSFIRKRPLENQEEYRARIAGARFAYSTKRIKLTRYDIVNERFDAILFDREVYIPFTRAKMRAQNISFEELPDEVRVECTLCFKPGAYDGVAARPELMEVLSPRFFVANKTNYREYVFKATDKGIWYVAQKLLGNGNRYPEIMKLNGLQKSSDVKPGMTLKIPAR